MTTAPTYSESECETAMCLWEAVIVGLGNDSPMIQRLIDEAGTVAARFTVASWIPECEAEWNKVKDEYDQPFDWEFCPAFLQRKLAAMFPELADECERLANDAVPNEPEGLSTYRITETVTYLVKAEDEAHAERRFVCEVGIQADCFHAVEGRSIELEVEGDT